MKKKKQNNNWREEIVKKYPLLYRDYHNSSPRESLMCFGFDGVGEGWKDILEDLSAKLEPIIQKWIKDNNPTDCICGCEKVFHEWIGNKDGRCLKLHYLPYTFYFKQNRSLSYPSKIVDWKGRKQWLKFKLYYIVVWRIKNYISRSVNFFLDFLHKEFGLTKTVPCFCKQFKLNHPCASQVKEKFAGLRFYTNYWLDEFEKPIREAEKKSTKTCERCSKPGKVRKGGWLKTLCDKCNKTRY